MSLTQSDFFNREYFKIIPGVYVYFDSIPVGKVPTYHMTVSISVAGINAVLTGNVVVDWSDEEFASRDEHGFASAVNDALYENLAERVDVVSNSIILTKI